MIFGEGERRRTIRTSSENSTKSTEIAAFWQGSFYSCLAWEKESPTGFLNSNYKPLSLFEDIVVFSKGTVGSKSKLPIRYYPQGLIQKEQVKRNRPNSTWRRGKGYGGNNKLNSDTEYVTHYANYPTDILKFSRDRNAVHPTQKPVALLEYLIKTYTKECEVVMDNCMGSGSAGIACKTRADSL